MDATAVLIVDDDRQLRAVLRTFLEGEGFRVREAENGRQAIAHLEGADELPDILLLDLVMPEVDGYAVLDYLQRNQLDAIPVLVVSARNPGLSLLQALNAQLRDFIAKPFDLDELLLRMQQLLQRSPQIGGARSSRLRIYTLGSLRVYRGDMLLFDESWRHRPAKTIFKLLFTRRRKRIPKDVLQDELWPDASPEIADNRLRVAVHVLRKQLGEQKQGVPRFVGQLEGTYYVDSSVPYWSDVEEFERNVRQARARLTSGMPEPALRAFQQAEALYQDDYLRDDPYADWVVPVREHLRETYLAMLAEMAAIHATQDRPEEAARYCRKILRVEPWREEVYRRLMEHLLAAHRPQEALRAYEQCARVLRSDLGITPSPETAALRDRILTRAGNGELCP